MRRFYGKRRPQMPIEVLVDDSVMTVRSGGRVEVTIANDSGAVVVCAVHVLDVHDNEADLAVTFRDVTFRTGKEAP